MKKFLSDCQRFEEGVEIQVSTGVVYTGDVARIVDGIVTLIIKGERGVAINIDHIVTARTLK